MARAPAVDRRIIAERLGVSRQVVSAILGGRTGSVRYSRETAGAVLAMAETMGFRPDRGRLAHLHLVISRSVTVVSEGLLDAILAQVHAEGLTAAVELVPPGGEPRRPERRHAAGRAVLAFPEPSDAWPPRVAAWGSPVLWVNLPGVSGARVDYDEADGMRQMVGWLQRTGRRNPAFLYPYDVAYTRARIDGFRAACAAVGMERAIVERHAVFEMASSMASRLRLHPEIDAVIIEHPMMMHHLLEAVRFCGRSVPAQVQPCTFFHVDYMRVACRQAMCLDVRPVELARHLLERCRQLVAGGGAGVDAWTYQLRTAIE